MTKATKKKEETQCPSGHTLFTLFYLSCMLFCLKNYPTEEPSLFDQSGIFIEDRISRNNGDEDMFFLKTKNQAERGIIDLQSTLAYAYFYGIGTNPDKKNAVKWWKTAT